MYQASCARTGSKRGGGLAKGAHNLRWDLDSSPRWEPKRPRGRIHSPGVCFGRSSSLVASSGVRATTTRAASCWQRRRAVSPLRPVAGGHGVGGALGSGPARRSRASAGVERDRSPCASQAASCGDAHMGKRQRGSSPPTFSCERRLCAPPMRLFRFFRGISCPSVAMHELCRISVPTLATRCLTSQAHLAPGGSIRANRGATHISTSIAPRLTVTLSD